jgi:hypothetical protein
MRLYFYAFIIPIIFAVSEGWSVEPYEPVRPDPVLESWRWRSFPEFKGKGLFCLTEASDGAMWFGHDTGVERYDGIHCITQLRQCLSDLEALGETTQPLAIHLSELTQKIDMAGIKGVLEEIRTQS